LLTAEERRAPPKELLSTILSRWLPASVSLMETIAIHLPSPVEAQRYRTDILYTGPQDDATAQAMRTCDPKGTLGENLVLFSFRSFFLSFSPPYFSFSISPSQCFCSFLFAVVYISKMIPVPNSTKFFGFGRVFSGTVSTSQTVRILGPQYNPKVCMGMCGMHVNDNNLFLPFFYLLC
jgi:elongation factor 2